MSALLLLRSECCAPNAPPPVRLSTLTMWAVPAVVLWRGRATAVAAPCGSSQPTSGRCRSGVSGPLGSSVPLLLSPEGARPLTPGWLQRELAVLTLSELDGAERRRAELLRW